MNAYILLLLFILQWTVLVTSGPDLTSHDAKRIRKRNAIGLEDGAFYSHKELINFYKNEGIISTQAVADVMLQVDRKNYRSGASNYTFPYSNAPDEVGFGSMRTPTMCALALEMLKDFLREGNKALDIGCGSGYLTTCMALMVGRTGYAVGVEYYESDLRHANNNIITDNKSLYYTRRVRFVASDGDLEKGYFKDGPYDAIFFGTNPEQFLRQYPLELLSRQLQLGGRMMVLVMRNSEDFLHPKFIVYDKDMEGKINPMISVSSMENDDEITYQLSYLMHPITTTTEHQIVGTDAFY